ncbi:disks large homolog 5 [Scaptodrosophila lebanonensis]|uniref:Disks large homolog 5 n=1 Tax=Drosophila lebanonensis TaxID=7225 RepID=A0A6J2U7S2_DROLE|nr:disks large homolog 5 [Scaptodrosophila lebanonensis]
MAEMTSGDLSLTSTSSQEEESSEYVGYDSTLRAPSNSSTAATNMANNNGAGNVVNSNVSSGNAAKYMLDLNTLRHQHSDMERRYYYVSDRNKFTDIAAENARLKQDNKLLEHKVLLLENQNGNAPPASSNAFYFNKPPCDGSCSDKLAELKKERNMWVVEREKYKKSYIELEKERNFYRDRGDEIQTLKVMLSKENKNVVSLTEELNQLLSEKDNVLQEHQKMSDDLALANKEIERLKKDELICKSEIKSLQLANADLKKRDLLKSRESSWSKEFSDSKDEGKELEKLRKNLEKALSEVDRAVQDAEEAKRVRDWAISQREKIVQERDSVKTLCDNLRKERDKAISDLLLAIRDSEKIKKQKDEAQKKIDLLKEQIENQNLDSASRRSFRMSSYEAVDMFEIELSNYHDADLGIILDDTNKRQLVCGVTNSSPAFGKLKINDVICKVNNLDCQALSKRMVLDEIRASAPRSLLLVSRTRYSKRHAYSVHLNMRDNANHGLQLDMGVFIAKIEKNSLASYEPELDVGDRVLSINNKSMDSVQSIDEVMQLLNDTRNETVSIFALKYVQNQLGGYGEGQNRMTTSYAQTDSIDSMQHVSNSGSAKHPSKFADFLRKLKFSKPGTTDDSFEQEHDDAIAALDSVLSENSSEKSKENLFKNKKRTKKEKEDAGKSMGTWPRTNISHESATGTIVQRSEKKRALMSLFSAGPINVDRDDDIGDKEEPPPLPPQLSKPLAHIRHNGNGSAIKSHPNRNSNPVSSAASTLFQPNPNNSSNATNSSAAGGGASYPRHSLYATADMLPDPHKPLQRPAPLMGANARIKLPSNERYGAARPHNSHRFSLNITPAGDFYQPKTSGQQAQQQVMNNTTPGSVASEFSARKQQMFDMFQQQQPAPPPKANAVFMPLSAVHANSRGSAGNQPGSAHSDVISLKSQNSIESILSAKSPPISEYSVLSMYPKRIVPMPQAVKHVPKYPSDSESIGSGVGSNYTQHALSHMPGNRHTLFPSFGPSNHPSHGIRYMRRSSPLTLPSPPPLAPATPHDTQSGSNAIGIPTDLEFVSPSAINSHSQGHGHGLGHQHPSNQHTHPSYLSDYAHPHYPYGLTSMGGMGVGSTNVTGVIYEGGTFPRKKDNQRLRIPSNPSVASKNTNMVKNSSGSIDHQYASSGMVPADRPTAAAMMSSVPSPLIHASFGANGGGSGRGSPMPQVHVEVLSHGGSKRNANVPADFLCPGDLRRVTIDKSDKSLGITIQCNNNGGGIFVSTVADKSTAMRAGLQVGDQLLEVCGINMRAATNDIAANVLRQCGNSITMLVQYNPEKFHSAEYEGTNNLEPESSVNHSGSPTPRNSPRPPARNALLALPPNAESTERASSNLLPQSNSLLSHQSIKDQSFTDSLENQSDISSNQDIHSSTTTASDIKPTSTSETLRYVTLHMDKSKNLGIKLFGGNQVGIFVHDVAAGSPSDHAGIRKGDQILDYNGVDLRGVTAEQAANEISKLTDTVTMLVQNKLQTLKQIWDKPGDSFYIRVGFDRTGELTEDDLRFVKDEVLYVDNTVFNGTFGLWRAWKLDAMGHRKECGIIPSQMKVEEELRSGEVVDCDTGTARRGSTSARRSFFRRKKNQRSSSRDSTEIASFSNTQLSFFPDSGILNDDGGVLSYQRVELLDSPIRRPVLIIGPLSECVMDRLKIDFSNLFKLCEVTAMDCSQEAMEEGLKENIFVDYRRRGNKFECTTVEAISNACKNDRRHCLLDVSISAVERLQRLQIYPIVLLLRFKSAKQIRDIRDFGIDKISPKAAKEMYERALKLEFDYKQYISAVIPGVSIKHMCTQIKDAVDKEQDKLLWVPTSNA